MAKIYKDIRKAIRSHSSSQRQIAIRAEIGVPHMCDFMQDKRGLSVESLERLADCLDLIVVVKPKKKNKHKGRYQKWHH